MFLFQEQGAAFMSQKLQGNFYGLSNLSFCDKCLSNGLLKKKTLST